ncbi:hypothetical protein ACWF82_03380 [Nocardia sp. NPDC055053]
MDTEQKPPDATPAPEAAKSGATANLERDVRVASRNGRYAMITSSRSRPITCNRSSRDSSPDPARPTRACAGTVRR